MFLWIWGSNSKEVDLGFVESKVCANCEKTRPFKLILQYCYSHFFFIFGWLTSKKYLLLCEECQHGESVDSNQIEATLDRHPIPFMRRYGWTFLFAYLVGLLLFAIFFWKPE